MVELSKGKALITPRHPLSAVPEVRLNRTWKLVEVSKNWLQILLLVNFHYEVASIQIGEDVRERCKRHGLKKLTRLPSCCILVKKIGDIKILIFLKNAGCQNNRSLSSYLLVINGIFLPNDQARCVFVVNGLLYITAIRRCFIHLPYLLILREKTSLISTIYRILTSCICGNTWPIHVSGQTLNYK